MLKKGSQFGRETVRVVAVPTIYGLSLLKMSEKFDSVSICSAERLKM